MTYNSITTRDNIYFIAGPAAANFLQQHAKFDRFIEEFNQERPHEALGIKCPAEKQKAQ